MAKISIIIKDPCFKELIYLELQRLGHTFVEKENECAIFITDSESEHIPKSAKRILISNDMPPKGAEYVLRRPLDLAVLRNCISSILDRNAIQKTDTKNTKISVNKKEKCAIVGEKKIQLTENEFLLLSCLLESDGEPISRDKINALLMSSGNTPEVYVCNLRKKLTSNDGVDPIITVRGKGYKLR